MNKIKEFEENNKNLFEFIKYNLVSFSITLLQLLLANILPLVFDGVTTKLPVFLRPIFNPQYLFTGNSKYVIDGVVTLGYVLPFLLSNTIANIYGYFVNMKVTFKQKTSRRAFVVYVIVLVALILFTTWFQGLVVGKLATTSISSLSRTIASLLAGLIQMAVIYPLEKLVLPKI